MAAAPQQKKEIFLSPIGIARYVHLNKPDAFRDSKPKYKTQLLLDGAERDHFKGVIDKLIDDAYAELTADMPKAKQNKIGKAYPYEEELDGDGNETGRIAFRFSMNAEIVVKGETVVRKPVLIDSKRLYCPNVQVWSGSEIRVAYTMRSYLNDATQKVGVTLDLLKVQIIKLASASSRPDNTFDEIEGGWSNEVEPAGSIDDEIPF